MGKPNTMENSLKILDQQQISHRLDRMAYQIYEENFEESSLFIAGIAERGYQLGSMMQNKLVNITGKRVELGKIVMNKKDPINGQFEMNFDPKYLQNQIVILADDVLNTGKTMFHATKPFTDVKLNKLKILTLVNRHHLEFPLAADYVGLSLATTLQEHIKVDLRNGEEAAYLG